MTVLKYWDGTSWVPAVVGRPGPQGESGIVPTGDGNPPDDQTVLWLDETTDAAYPTGPKGDTGNTPVISVSAFGITGQTPTVTLSGSVETPIITFGIPSSLNFLTPQGSFDIFPRHMLTSGTMPARTNGYVPFAAFTPNVDLALTTSSTIGFFVGGTQTVVGSGTDFITKAVLLELGVDNTTYTVISRTNNIGALTTANTKYSGNLDTAVTLTAGKVYAWGIMQTCTTGTATNYAGFAAVNLGSANYSLSFKPVMAGQYQGTVFRTKKDIEVGDTLTDDTSSGLTYVMFARITI